MEALAEIQLYLAKYLEATCPKENLFVQNARSYNEIVGKATQTKPKKKQNNSQGEGVAK